ncbi:Tn3 family transposase, partial [Pseudomonas aeruginosa]
MQRLDSFEKRPFYETVSAIARKGHQHPKISAINLSHESKFVNSQSLTSKTNSNSAYVGFQFHCSPTPTYAKLSWLQAWHIRDETYSAALAELVNHQYRHAFAAHWGDGT